MSMKKYVIEVYYQASVYHEVDAESEEEAKKLVGDRIYSEVPYNELYGEIVFTEEVTPF